MKCEPMIKVKVVAIITIIPYVGGHKKQFVDLHDHSTVRDLIEKLIELYGEALRTVLLNSDMELNYGIAMLLNGRNILALQGFDTPLSSGDEFLIFPPVGGG